MKPDFTIAGTKLPVIPKGVEYLFYPIKKRPKNPTEEEFNSEHEEYVSYGVCFIKGIKYVKAEIPKYKQEDFYLIKLSTIERLAKEQGMYNTNTEQMKPTITLQNDGSVQIANTTTLDAETVNTIFELKKAESEKPKLEVGKWYKSTKSKKILAFITEVLEDRFIYYGFNAGGDHVNNDWYTFADSGINMVPSTPQEVQQRLTDYAVNVLGMKEGSHVDRTAINSEYNNEDVCKLDWNKNQHGTYNESKNELYVFGRLVFKDGIFATVIQPTQITASELLREHNLIVVG
jgi:hypothetical protein